MGWGWNTPSDDLANNAYETNDPRRDATLLYAGQTNEPYGESVPAPVSFFRHLNHEYPDLRTASFVSWGAINDKVVRGSATDNFQGDADGGNSKEQDKRVFDKALEEVQRENAASVLFVQFNDVDSQGHAHGFTLENADYLAALGIIDGYVKELLSAAQARPTYGEEDWLFIVTTDHGGNAQGHGGTSYEEQNAFIVLNNEKVAPFLLEGAPERVTEKVDYAVETLIFGEGVSAELPDMNSLGLDVNADFTIELRVRATKHDSDPVILGNKKWMSGANPGFCIANSPYGGGNHVRFNLSDGTRKIDLDGAVLEENGDWVHASMVVNRKEGVACIYDAGQLVASENIATRWRN